MDVNKARELSLREFSDSVEAEVKKILSGIKLNLRRGEIDYLIIGAEGDAEDRRSVSFQQELFLSRHQVPYADAAA